MNTQIEEIKNRLDIVDVVSKYVQLKQAGKNFSGVCPFHTEKTPSFIVSPEIQRYKCFGCGETGDIFNFIQKIENIDFPEALEKLAKEAGVELKKISNNTEYDRLEEINKKATIYFYQSLKKSNIAYKYIKNRGFSDESIKIFGIGYAPGGQDLLSFIQKDIKYSKQELLNSGLFTLKEGKIKGKFFKRIMFPIRSSSGRVVAFTGRVLPGDDFGPKYMNTPETPIFHKKDNVYAQYESRQEIRKLDLAIVCEGTTDVISSHQIGIKNIVAPLGTALTKEQLEKISHLTKNIIFLFDSDTAGQKALERAFILAQNLNLNCFATNTLPYKDIDEMIKKEPEMFKKLIEKRIDAYTYMLLNFVKDKNLNKFEEYNKTLEWIKNTLSCVKNRDLYSFYIKKTYKLTKINIQQDKIQTDKKYIGGNKSILKIRDSREEKYLQYLIFQSNIHIPSSHDIKYFEDENIKEILSFIQSNPNLTREDLIKKIKDDIHINILENAIFHFSNTESNKDELDEVYKYIVIDYISNKEKEINVRIAQAEEKGDLKESERLLKEFLELNKEKHKYEQNS